MSWARLERPWVGPIVVISSEVRDWENIGKMQGPASIGDCVRKNLTAANRTNRLAALIGIYAKRGAPNQWEGVQSRLGITRITGPDKIRVGPRPALFQGALFRDSNLYNFFGDQPRPRYSEARYFESRLYSKISKRMALKILVVFMPLPATVTTSYDVRQFMRNVEKLMLA
ncbi:hypothetical protein Ddc_03083 [Ditylenchus destructor]|nr:hypothetical protein Ddc_03083 [Ditylenchus destructor]